MTLQELTGRESGAVVYSDGSVWVGNWTSIDGIPRKFCNFSVGLVEVLGEAESCDVPEGAVDAMEVHERDVNGLDYKMDVSKVRALWLADHDVTVVYSLDWG